MAKVEYNDRLLLGLKGTMSEAELHILKQRLYQGTFQKARRGALSFALPIGYVHNASGEVVYDPDEQVQHVVRLIFRKFDELRTLHALLRYLVQHDIQLGVRLREGPAKGTLEWRRPNRMTLQNLLKNPLYAGAYAYGRRQVDARRKQPGRPSTGRVTRARHAYHVLLKDHMPAYITWVQSTASRPGPAGPPMSWCRRCGPLDGAGRPRGHSTDKRRDASCAHRAHHNTRQ
jgi:recombinase